MRFGIYPGGVAGTDTGLATGKPDNPAAIHQALQALEQGGSPVLVRGYVHYTGKGKVTHGAPENVLQYATPSRKIDLVLGYRSATYDAQDWTSVIENVVQYYGSNLHSIQITEEPNLKGVAAGDGDFENIEIALLHGVLAAKKAVVKTGHSIQVGFNAVLSFTPADPFWSTIGSYAFTSFREALDYVGLDFYPDVFRPLPADAPPDVLETSVRNALRYFRNETLHTAGIPHTVPIRVTENGWPTTGGQAYEKQAAVIETIVRTVHSLKTELNITGYELFSLRDADSGNGNLFYQFGLLHDDYSPKPAFQTYCNLVGELGDRDA
jgi:hypothetical protein